MELRDYVFLGTTQSLCPGVPPFGGRQDHRPRRPAFIFASAARITASPRISSAPTWRISTATSTANRRGCRARSAPTATRAVPTTVACAPEHEQHTCIGLIEVSNIQLQPEMSDVLRRIRAGRQTHRLRHLHAHGRALRLVGRRRRRAATVRRRTDVAPRRRAHGPLRLRAADPGRHD